MHFEHTPDLFLLILHRVQIGALEQATRIDTDESERADEGIVHDLERKCRERRIVRRWAAVWLERIHVEALHVFNIERRRQIINNSVEQWLDALVFKRRTATDRNKRLIQRTLADQRFQRCNVWLITFKICFHGDIVLLNGKFDQFAAIFRRFRS